MISVGGSHLSIPTDKTAGSEQRDFKYPQRQNSAGVNLVDHGVHGKTQRLNMILSSLNVCTGIL